MSKFEKEIGEIVKTAESEKRSLNDAELTSIDGLKKQIADEKKANEEAVKEATSQKRSASARFEPEEVKGSSSYLRSIAKGEADLGNVEVINDIVRQFNLTSPLFASHGNVQKRSTGNSYAYTRITSGGAGYVKTEGDAGTTDSGSTLEVISQTFKTYSAQKILVTQEALDDAAADISSEVMTLGLSKSTIAFGSDCIIALKRAFGGDGTGSGFTPTETAGASYTLADVIAAYFEIPVRNRYGVKFMGNGNMVATLLNLITNVTAGQAAWIGLSAENIVEDSSFQDGLLFVGNPTLALAVGMKIPVRTVALEVSEGHTFEVQPRFAVGLRDGSAVACRAIQTFGSNSSSSSSEE